MESGRQPSWYLDENGKNVTLWLGLTWQFRRKIARFNASHYALARANAPAAMSA